MNKTVWKFIEPPNMAVIANRKIITSGAWIAYVSHDSDDGAWQFHISSSDSVNENDAVLVSLQEIVNIDHTITILADLPLGWCAWRNSKDDVWERAPISE